MWCILRIMTWESRSEEVCRVSICTGNFRLPTYNINAFNYHFYILLHNVPSPAGRVIILLACPLGTETTAVPMSGGGGEGRAVHWREGMCWGLYAEESFSADRKMKKDMHWVLTRTAELNMPGSSQLTVCEKTGSLSTATSGPLRSIEAWKENACCFVCCIGAVVCIRERTLNATRVSCALTSCLSERSAEK